MAIEHKKYVCADALNNNNKFWEYIYNTYNEMCTVIYGRVGKTRNEDDPKHMTRGELDSKIREKLKGRGKEGTPTYKPPYREIAILAEKADIAPTGPAMKEVVREAAKKQLGGGDTELSKLIERLVEANKHELHKATGGQMDIDLKTGIISTPIGVITKDTINQARKVLDLMDKFVPKSMFDDKEFIENLNTYLMLVPQAVGHKRGWHRDFFTSHNTLQRQSTLLDQLDASADLAEARVNAAKTTVVQTTLATTPNIFNADLKIVSDPALIAKIEKMFFDSINNKHESKNMKPKMFYEVNMTERKAAFDNDGAKLPNIQMLWHGTRVFNVLSILKSGLFCPPKSGSFHVTGRMFGDGIYGSDQSTKALNYARGYWDGGARDKNCFMFIVDFAMGKSYTPRSSYESLPKAGYDSTFAEANKSGVMNNEMIVYRNSQVNIRYLIEFEEK